MSAHRNRFFLSLSDHFQDPIYHEILSAETRFRGLFSFCCPSACLLKDAVL